MEVEIRWKGNCITEYNTLTTKELIKVINNPYKSKRGFTELRRELCVCVCVFVCVWCVCVCDLVCVGVSCEQKHAVKLLSVLL